MPTACVSAHSRSHMAEPKCDHAIAASRQQSARPTASPSSRYAVARRMYPNNLQREGTGAASQKRQMLFAAHQQALLWCLPFTPYCHPLPLSTSTSACLSHPPRTRTCQPPACRSMSCADLCYSPWALSPRMLLMPRQPSAYMPTPTCMHCPHLLYLHVRSRAPPETTCVSGMLD